MITTKQAVRAALAATGLALAATAGAQIPFTNTGTGTNNAFPAQNPLGPVGPAYQVAFPYPGQCLAGPDAALFPTLPACTAHRSSFSSPSERTDAGWAGGGVKAFSVVQPVIPGPGTGKFVHEVLNPMDYTPDTATYPGADYYVIGLHESWGAQNIATAGTVLGPIVNPPFGLFPDPTRLGALCGPASAPVPCDVPNGMQWTGLTCEPLAPATTCSCPADASPAFVAKYCNGPGHAIPAGNPLFTPIWGVGQMNMGGGPVTSALAANGIGVPGTLGGAIPSGRWSANGYAATWPSISIRGTIGTPVVVKWVNEFPNNHVLCPHPEAADWPCAIDRTFMGVKATIDPALTPTALPEGVNRYGSPQQPDNSWVTHLHGGEIPPAVDGFAEKWFGNAVTSALYTPTPTLVNPAFENPLGIKLRRPAASSDVYTYPLVGEEALIWFHDHTLGKTHHNVIAGPAGFFPLKEPRKHGKVTAGACKAASGQSCDYTWLDPVTEPRGALGIPMYDLFLAIQDRAFNDDGSINFSNGLGQPIPPVAPAGYSPVTNGANPLVHPVWIPEYFGDHVVVNGTLWPKATVEPGWHRVRVVDGSDSRCYTVGLNVDVAGAPTPAPGTKVANNLAFWVIASDQGYLKNPVRATSLTMCPGERYELLVNFGQVGNGVPVGGAATVFLTNSAPAPFPAGITPQAAGSPYADLNVLLRFDVAPAKGPGLKSCGQVQGRVALAPTALTWDPAAQQAQNLSKDGNGRYAFACMPANPALVTDPGFVDIRPAVFPIPAPAAGAPPARIAFNDGKTLQPIVRQVYLNEKVDGVTLAPLGMQLNGVPFEYKVTETPRAGSREIWQFVNLTVDAHPMHPHLVRHQLVARQTFSVGQYKALLCGSTTCQPGTAPGGEMQVVPDVTPTLTGAPIVNTAATVEGAFKDTTQVPPGRVTTIVADWSPRWAGSGAPGHPVGTPNAPGTTCGNAPCAVGSTPWTYEAVFSGPYVWHCHINSHEDSEMMRTSLVVP